MLNKMINIRKQIILCGLMLFLVPGFIFAAEGAVTRRFGIFIGSNNGGRDRVMLRYAVSDARSVSAIFAGMGGIVPEDNMVLIEPTVEQINRCLDNFQNLSVRSKQESQRTELIFYYSGHSDEDGILLNRERYSYRELRERINTVEADITIVILDSCSSGAITRAKGGVKTQPFLFDSSVSAEGYAFLTSSSADEASQESDLIESSYFTHSLLAGLRGAADSVGDGRVTLNELYRYAYTETMARTETSLYGTQHPSYDIQLSGSGDVVLTDIKEISAGLVISENITGRISIRDGSDFLVAELTKVTAKPLALGLEPGLYRITLQRGDDFYRTEIKLQENQTAEIRMENFSLIAAASGSRTRGNSDIITDDENIPVYPFNLQLLPGLDVFGHSGEKAVNNFLIGLLVANGYSIRGIGAASLALFNTGNVQGVQASGIFNIASGYVQGMQASGIFNIAGGYVQGVQAAGIFSIAGNVRGVQSSGIFNWNGGEFMGIQSAGIFNYTEKLLGMQASLVNVNLDSGGKGAMFGLVNVSGSQNMVPFGLVNVIKNGILHPAIYLDDMLFTNFSFRSGSKYFYTTLGIGANNRFKVSDTISFSGDKFLYYRAGIGFEFPINKLFIDLEFLGGSIINLDNVDISHDKNIDPYDRFINTFNYITPAAQVRLVAGYKFFEHLGIFAGVSYDYFYRHFSTSPDPWNSGIPAPGIENGKHTHKLGFFGGLQF